MQKKTKHLKGVITVEMSIIFPIVLFVVVGIIYVIFYYHDKNIMLGAAAETAVVGAQLERKPGQQGRTDLEAFYQERTKGKLILFAQGNPSVRISKKKVVVEVVARHRRGTIQIQQSAPILKPEQLIRGKRLIDHALGGETEADKDEQSGSD